MGKREEDRKKVYYKCSVCNKEKWTLQMHYIEPIVCPSCKRKQKDPGMFQRIAAKAKQTAERRGSYKAGGQRSKATKLARYGAVVPQTARDKISDTLRSKPEDEKQQIYQRKTQAQRSRNNGAYFNEEAKASMGAWTKTEAGRQKISELKTAERFAYRNSEEHIEFERRRIEDAGYEVLSVGEEADGERFFSIRCFNCGSIFKWHMIGDGCKAICKDCFSGGGTSQAEKEVAAFLRSVIDDEVVENDRKTLNGKELDIYIPSRKLAIEYDGLHWHNNVDNSWKFEACKKLGIRLIRISEPEWLLEKKKVQSFLKSAFNVYEHRVGARECTVREISTEAYKQFCVCNHLQGYAQASVKLGLFYHDQLVEVMSFAKARFSKECEWEMMRECSLAGWHIAGGKSKLLAHFERRWQPRSILSYCEADKFSGVSYQRCGFTLARRTSPGYVYYAPGSFEPLSRMQFQKHKLADKLAVYDSSKTEWENMKANGYSRLFDYGQYVFVKSY